MIYVDNAATTRLDPRVLDKMLPYLNDEFFNPSALYYPSKQIRRNIDDARQHVANLLSCDETEIVFTSSGTEANNTAIIGVAMALKYKGRHLITSRMEHHSVLNCFKWLETQGFKVTYLPVNEDFLVDPSVFKESIRKDTVLASIMHVNNEVGTIQPIDELSRIARRNGVLFHTDAVQSVGTEELDTIKLQVDLLTISGHKIYGPKGVGALFVRQGTPFTKILHGGSQENGKRASTENVMGIVGLGEACKWLLAERSGRKEHVARLKEVFLEEIKDLYELKIHGGTTSVDSICSVGFKNLDGEALLMMLGRKNIFASMGAACDSKELEPSHVLIAGSVDPQYLLGTLRFSFGMNNREEEMKTVAVALKTSMSVLKTF